MNDAATFPNLTENENLTEFEILERDEKGHLDFGVVDEDLSIEERRLLAKDFKDLVLSIQQDQQRRNAEWDLFCSVKQPRAAFNAEKNNYTHDKTRLHALKTLALQAKRDNDSFLREDVMEERSQAKENRPDLRDQIDRLEEKLDTVLQMLDQAPRWR